MTYTRSFHVKINLDSCRETPQYIFIFENTAPILALTLKEADQLAQDLKSTVGLLASETEM